MLDFGSLIFYYFPQGVMQDPFVVSVYEGSRHISFLKLGVVLWETGQPVAVVGNCTCGHKEETGLM